MLPASELKEGKNLHDISHLVTQEQINLYAQASRDFNPIHVDVEYARNSPLGGTIAHGMMILGYTSQMMTAAFGDSWRNTGKLNIRFRAPVRPGDTVTATGRILRVEKDNDNIMVNVDILSKNQTDEAVITGDTRVEVRA